MDYLCVPFSESSRLNYWMDRGAQADGTSQSSTSLSSDGANINHSSTFALTPSLYTWSTNVDEELSSLTRSLTDPCNEAGTKEFMDQDFDRSEANDFSVNGIETDLTPYDLYQHKLRRDYTLALDTTTSAGSSDPRARGNGANNLKMYKSTVCVFCKNNGENLSVYGTHILKDQMGRVSCPILQRYTCPVCGASGPGAHTLKYCPYNTNYKPSGIKNCNGRPVRKLRR